MGTGETEVTRRLPHRFPVWHMAALDQPLLCELRTDAPAVRHAVCPDYRARHMVPHAGFLFRGERVPSQVLEELIRCPETPSIRHDDNRPWQPTPEKAKMMTSRIALAAASLLALGVYPAPAQEKDSPEQIVQKQVDAFNRRDIDDFLATYAYDIKLYDFPGKETLSGQEAMRKTYGKLFADNPELKADVLKRIVQGDTVIYQEEVTAKGQRRFLGVAIYQVKDGKIAAVWFVR
jgi:hypothetical protein